MNHEKFNLKGVLFLLFLFWGFCLAAQSTMTVRGKIVDQDTKESLIGATVRVNKTTIGTITDASGNFSISVPSNGNLVISYIGYEKAETPVNGQSYIEITLEPNTQQLDEVVAIGYGNARKSDLSGAVSTINVGDKLKGISSNLSTILEGQIPGVTVQSNGGDPLSSPTISIRGAGSPNGDQILTVVDGIPGAPYNIDDVESITVLKDGASAAIYGSSVGSGGVILITTKKAQAGKIHVDVNVYTGIQSAWKKPAVLNAAQYDQVWADNIASSGGTLPITASPTLYPYGAITRTNWINAIFQTGQLDHYGVSLSGGSENLKVSASVAYDHNQGILLNTYSSSLGSKINLEFDMAKWAILRETVNGQYSNGQGNVSDESAEDPLISAVFMPSSATIYEHDQNGNIVYGTNGKPEFGGTVPKYLAAQGISGYGDDGNPVAMLDRLTQYRPSGNLFTTSSLELKPMRTLSVKSDFSVGLNPSYNQTFNPESPEIGHPNMTNSLYIGNTWNYNWVWQTVATYSNTFADKHDVTVMVGHSMDYAKYRSNSTTTYGYANEDTYSQVETNATNWSQTAPTESISEESSEAVFGRLSYSYDDRYFLTGSLRWDASSKLYYKNNSGTFPGISGAWKVSSEKFFKELNLPVNLFKFRASWGQVGNNAMAPNYSYNSSILTDNQVSYIGASENTSIFGQYLATIANTSLTWERTQTTDFGADLSLLNNRLTLSADYFNKTTKNLIEQLNVPTQAGITQAPYGNVGQVSNKGIELSASFTQQIGKVGLTLNGNLSTVKNVVENLDGLVIVDPTSVNSMYPMQSQAGEPWHSFYVVKTAGVFQNQAQIDAYVNAKGNLIQPNAQPGDLIFVDSNHDGSISTADRIYDGSYLPTLTYAFGTNITWSGFDFNVFFQGVSGNKIFNAFKQMGLSGRQQGNNMLAEVLQSWNYNKTSGIPRLALTNDNNNNYGTVSDFYLESGAYLRLKNLSIGYTLPKSLLSKIGLPNNSIRIYINGQNLLTFTKYTGFDPEVSNNGVDGGTYPVARVISGGINIHF